MFIHFIAIGGSAMHNLAIALLKKGYQVSGSDDAIFEPSRSRLEKHGLLPVKMGWNPSAIQTNLDAVILGMHARADNPELARARELGIKIYSYPEYIYEQAKEKTRLVVGGSHGKTTITSMILHVLNHCGKDFDYLVGAQLDGFDTMVKLSENAELIVIEGDEYLSSPIDRRPKFHLYKANIAIISGIAWDHINVFPTQENYIEQFGIFLETIEPGGTIIYCEEDPVVKSLVEKSPVKINRIPYSTPPFRLEDGITQLLVNDDKVSLKVFGRHNLLNLTAARLACQSLGIGDDKFYSAISSFKGASKRLELLASNRETSVFKDFAHSPSKLMASIAAVKEQFPDRQLYAVFELHTFSSLNKTFLSEYAGSMEFADEAIVFIDKHALEQKRMDPIGESQIKEAFGNTKLKFFNNAETLEGFLRSVNYKSKNLLLMSSGNFGGIDLTKISDIAAKIN